MVFLALTFTPLVAAAQQPCTADAQRVVNELYRHMLERQAEAASSYWVNQLESNRMTVRDVVREIAKSREHTERFLSPEAGEGVQYERAVARLYRHVLARQPDAAGQRAFAQLARSEGIGAVVDQLVNSTEYTEQFGDWGAPGSGGVRYCAPNNRTVSQTPTYGSRGNGPGRFAGMDRNGDGVITRAEWRGNDQSFRNQDWNNDGVLSGDEVNPGAQRWPARTDAEREARRAERFATLDVNDNGRIEAREWDGTVAAFNRLDVNNDNILSRAEMVRPGLDDVDSADQRQRFDSLDLNRNGRIEAREWDGTVAAFYRLDVNDDNVLTRAEMASPGVDAPRAVATTGQEIRVEGRERWTDTLINVRAGDTLVFDADGTVRLSDNSNDVANAGGVLSGRRAANAPFSNQTAGALIGRIGGGSAFFVGNQRSVRAPATGRLYLGVNDDYLQDNAGDFQVRVTIER
jgi:phycobilisome linker polypeptide/uncharacterized protein DUF4214/EF hand domain-containing protein